MPGQLFEGNPVDEGTTGRSTDAPVPPAATSSCRSRALPARPFCLPSLPPYSKSSASHPQDDVLLRSSLLSRLPPPGTDAEKAAGRVIFPSPLRSQPGGRGV